MSVSSTNKPITGDGKTRLLVIDDDKKLCRLIRDYLESMGYEVEAAHTGPDGLEKAQSGHYQAIILDVMLPGMDGFEVLKQLRHTSAVPVLMLTSRGEEPDRIVGLEIGADDYLPKTFSTRELLARLRAAPAAQPGVSGRSTFTRTVREAGSAAGEISATVPVRASSCVSTRTRASHSVALGW